MFFEVDAGFDDGNAFGFEELFLERSVRFANEDFAVGAKDPVPGNTFALRSCAHGAACRPSAAGQTQGSCEAPIG